MNVTLAYFATETATATDRERWKPGVSIKPSIKHAAIARHRCTGGTETVSGVRRSGIADWRNKKNKGPSWRSTMLTPYSTKAARHSTAYNIVCTIKATAKTRKNERNGGFRSFFLVFAVAVECRAAFVLYGVNIVDLHDGALFFLNV